MNRWRLCGLLALALLAPARADDVPGSPADVQKRLEQLEKEMAMTRKILGALEELREINRRLAELERKVDEMQKPQVRVSNAPPPNTGTIRLQNRLSVPATIIVGGIPQRLQPGEQRDLQNQPAGTFEFEALVDGFGSLQPRATRTLQPGQIYTIFTYLP